MRSEMNDQQLREMLGDDLAERHIEWRNSQPAEPMSEEKIEYVTALTDAALDRRDTEATQSDPIGAAVQSRYRNIHQAAFGALEPVATTDLDEATFADELGLDLDTLARSKFEDHESATNTIGPLLADNTVRIHPRDAAEFAERLADDPRFALRAFREIETWRSPAFGRLTSGRDAMQSRNVETVLHHAARQLLAAHREGEPLTIEQALRRGRFIVDYDYRPGKRGHVPKRISTAGKFSNIHEALQKNVL